MQSGNGMTVLTTWGGSPGTVISAVGVTVTHTGTSACAVVVAPLGTTCAAMASIAAAVAALRSAALAALTVGRFLTLITVVMYRTVCPDLSSFSYEHVIKRGLPKYPHPLYDQRSYFSLDAKLNSRHRRTMIHRSAPSRRHSQLGVVLGGVGVLWFCALLSLVMACVCRGVSLYRSACVRACVWTLSGLLLVFRVWSWSRFCVWSCSMRKPVIDDQVGWAWVGR